MISGALAQARGCVDGMVWDVAQVDSRSYILIVDPDGDGIDAAAIGLYVLSCFVAAASRLPRSISACRGHSTGGGDA